MRVSAALIGSLDRIYRRIKTNSLRLSTVKWSFFQGKFRQIQSIFWIENETPIVSMDKYWDPHSCINWTLHFYLYKGKFVEIGGCTIMKLDMQIA